LNEEISDWQEDQDLPTKEKVDELIVVLMLDVCIDPDETISFYDALEKKKYVFN
jgi:hypothetical protein